MRHSGARVLEYVHIHCGSAVELARSRSDRPCGAAFGSPSSGLPTGCILVPSPASSAAHLHQTLYCSIHNIAFD